jgi:hypothetical protein
VIADASNLDVCAHDLPEAIHRVRVLEARGNGPKNFEALVGQLDPRIPGSGLEPLETLFGFFALDFHE